MTSGLSYRELLQTYLPRPITNEAEYNLAVAQMNELIDKGDLTQDEQDYLTLIGTLVMAYEDVEYPDRDFELRGLALLHALMDESNLKPLDLLPVFKTQSIAESIVDGQRALTSDFAGRLATYFSLPSDLFLESAIQPNQVPA